MNTAEVVRMKRVLALLLILMMVFSVCAFTEAEETPPETPVPAEAAEGEDAETVPLEEDNGDDSNPEPVDMMEEEELDADDEILQGQILRNGDQGDDVLALQTRLKDLG